MIFIASCKKQLHHKCFALAQSGLLLRKSPSLDSPIVTKIPYFSELDLIEYSEKKETIDENTSSWAKVKYLDYTGWVFGYYLGGFIRNYSPSDKSIYYLLVSRSFDIGNDSVEPIECGTKVSDVKCHLKVYKKEKIIYDDKDSLNPIKWFDKNNILMFRRDGDGGILLFEYALLNIQSRNLTRIFEYFEDPETESGKPQAKLCVKEIFCYYIQTNRDSNKIYIYPNFRTSKTTKYDFNFKDSFNIVLPYDNENDAFVLDDKVYFKIDDLRYELVFRKNIINKVKNIK